MTHSPPTIKGHVPGSSKGLRVHHSITPTDHRTPRHPRHPAVACAEHTARHSHCRVSQDSPGKQPTGMCVRDSFKELPPLMGGPATLNLPETWEGHWGPSFGTLLSIGVSGAALPARTRRAPCLTAPGLAAAEVILMETSPPSDPASGST